MKKWRKKTGQTQRLAGLQHQAQQPRLTPEAEDVKIDTKTRKRTKGAAADDEKHGDISSARAENDPTSLINLGNIAEPPAPEKGIGEALVNEGAEAPKPYIPPVEVRMPSPAASSHVPTLIAACVAIL